MFASSSSRSGKRTNEPSIVFSSKETNGTRPTIASKASLTTFKSFERSRKEITWPGFTSYEGMFTFLPFTVK